MRASTSRQYAAILTAIGVGVVWRAIDPEGWKPFEIILRYWWVAIPAWLAFALIDHMLMGSLGKRGADGRVEEYIDPTLKRLDEIEAAINRLHDYIQDIDPELIEENRLEREFLSGEGGMFAGMNHMEYVRDRELRGLRTKYGQSVWRDPEPNNRTD